MTLETTRLVKALTTLAADAVDKNRAAREIAGLIRSAMAYRWVGVYEVGDEDICAIGWDGPNEPTYPASRRQRDSVAKPSCPEQSCPSTTSRTTIIT